MAKDKTRRTLNLATYNEFVDKFQAESDRAAAVLGGAYLDSFLENALRSVLVADPRVDAMFDGQGALRSFASKTALAFALGIIAEPMARDIDLLRKVRNHFAHNIWEAGFDAAPVSDWCRSLVLVSELQAEMGAGSVELDEPRVRYLLTIAISTTRIAYSPKVPVEFRKSIVGY